MRILSLAVALLVGLAVAGFGQNTVYTYTNINVPGAYATWPTAINSSGQIVGYYQTFAGLGGAISQRQWHGFVYRNGVYTTIDVTNPDFPAILDFYGATAYWTAAWAISDSGVVFGSFYWAFSFGDRNKSGGESLFQYDLGSGTITISPEITDLSLGIDVTGMSSSGAVVGTDTASGAPFVYSNGNVTTLGGALASTAPVGINAAGWAALWGSYSASYLYSLLS
jgi:hypothetical protein